MKLLTATPFEIKLNVFEGPFDLLLFFIELRSNNTEIIKSGIEITMKVRTLV